ncbi:hypothetical protein DIE09_37635, partial [Burkholderia sp. Bp9010]
MALRSIRRAGNLIFITAPEVFQLLRPARAEFQLGAGLCPDAGYMYAIDFRVRQLPFAIGSSPY